jgi:hypothetical protein
VIERGQYGGKHVDERFVPWSLQILCPLTLDTPGACVAIIQAHNGFV